MLDMTLCEAADAIRDRRVGCEELLRASLDRVETRDPELNAVIAIEADLALDRARAFDRTAPAEAGALGGVPLGYKDMFHRAGSISTYGASEPHWRRADDTSPLLTALEAAGGIGCLRLNMAELAMGPTGHNANFGRCRNPHDPLRITGGSSSGSGAAVAAGYVFGALGSDTGGSVRLPASICGVVGLKPTQHLLPTTGMMPLSSSLDCPGLFARTCRDAARMFDVATGSSSEAGLEDPGRAAVLGVPRDYYLDGLDDDIAANFSAALRAFGTAGLTVEEVSLERQAELSHFADVVWKTEAAALHLTHLREGNDRLGRQVRARLVQGAGTRGIDYVDALKLRVLHLRRVLDGPLAAVDAIVIPTVPIATPMADAVSAEAGDEMRTILELISRNTRPFSFLGLPALSVPMGKDRNGMPLGLQIVGRPRSEALLLRLGNTLMHIIG